MSQQESLWLEDTKKKPSKLISKFRQNDLFTSKLNSLLKPFDHSRSKKASNITPVLISTPFAFNHVSHVDPMSNFGLENAFNTIDPTLINDYLPSGSFDSSLNGITAENEVTNFKMDDACYDDEKLKNKITLDPVAALNNSGKAFSFAMTSPTVYFEPPTRQNSSATATSSYHRRSASFRSSTFTNNARMSYSSFSSIGSVHNDLCSTPRRVTPCIPPNVHESPNEEEEEEEEEEELQSYQGKFENISYPPPPPPFSEPATPIIFNVGSFKNEKASKDLFDIPYESDQESHESFEIEKFELPETLKEITQRTNVSLSDKQRTSPESGEKARIFSPVEESQCPLEKTIPDKSQSAKIIVEGDLEKIEAPYNTINDDESLMLITESIKDSSAGTEEGIEDEESKPISPSSIEFTDTFRQNRLTIRAKSIRLEKLVDFFGDLQLQESILDDFEKMEELDIVEFLDADFDISKF
ncbi:hypothetical protein DAMA08_039700 [Martiniozyma asiatica (nom. inval.)]|nr:hypothetical protein DAMA08_039700 [Martiniozyma asiatica]